MLAIAPQNVARFFYRKLMEAPAARRNSLKQGVSAFRERTNEGSFEFEKIADKRLAN